jgi:transglutaminase-like putative cysteine protease
VSVRSAAGAHRFWPTAVTVVLVTAMLVTAMIPWWPVYESPAFIVAAAVAIVVGTAIGLAGARFRLPAWTVVVMMCGAYLVLGVPAAVPGRAIAGILPTPAGLVELVSAAALSWKQLITIAVPVGSYQALLVPPFLLGLIAATTAVTIALRSKYPATAVFPPALLLVAGIGFGVVHDTLSIEAGLAFFVTAVAWLVRVAIANRRAITSGRRVEAALSDARRVLGAAALVAIALVCSTAASLALPVPHRNVLRAELQPPFEPRAHVSPLAGFRAAFDPEVDDVPMFEVRGLPEGAGIRVAVLDSYDGIVYSVGGADGAAVSGQFSRVPYRLDQSEAPGESIELDVSVLGYDDVWVPGLGRLEQIEFGGPRSAKLAEEFFYNDATGTAAVQSGLESGDEYSAVAKVPTDPALLGSLRPGTSVLPPAPELPEALAKLLDEWAPALDAPGERLASVINGFHREGYVSHGLDDDEASRSGHSLDRLAELATERPMVGDGEQYAAAAALMARDIGFPARVVVGYVQHADEESGAEPADAAGGAATDEGSVVFRSDDRQAWIEVQNSEGEWITIDPNPEPRPIPEREPDQPTIVSRPQSALPPPAERTPVDELGTDPDVPPDEGDADADAWLQVLFGALSVTGFVILGLAVLTSPFLAIIIAKLRRRRVRRNAATAAERIEGGWQEFADSAADFGYPIKPMATRAEQAATVGGLAPLVLASVVDRAAFAPDGPDDGDDLRVWDAVDELQERLGAPRTRRERLRAAVSLTSLGGYAVTRKGVRS